ncbi:hypothetical protein [Bacillus chungangensis]|uniref:Phage gp36-like protein n=1 Tax=Bacillus chungangensis TaxID=587633 RepID=A0ABT9WTV8_9BACI|nr:hypothetical protein [Bacillus chungangensis]MDQ0176722.1 phage gp36-like protein [Bacillus chungangensis]
MYITAVELRSRIKSDLPDEVFEQVIAESTAMIHAYLGCKPANPMTETMKVDRKAWLTFEPASIISIRDTRKNVVVHPSRYEFIYRIVEGLRPGRYEIAYEIKHFEDMMAVIRGVCADLSAFFIMQNNETADGVDLKSEKIGDYQYVRGSVYEDVDSKRVFVRTTLDRLSSYIGVKAAVAL